MKGIFLMLFSLSFTVLVGCNNNSNSSDIVDDVVAEVVVEPIVELPPTPEEYIHFLFSEIQQANFDALRLPQDIIQELQNPQNSNFIYILQDSVKNVTYEIIDVEIYGDTATVITEITATNLEHIFELTLFSAVEELLPAVISEGIDIEELTETLIEDTFMVIYSSGQGGTVTNLANIDLVLVDDVWELTDYNVSFINALTGNLYSFIESMSEFLELFNQISGIES